MPLRQQRAERDLERAGGHVDVVVAAGRGVQVDAVHADADAVAVAHRALVAAHGMRQVLLDDARDARMRRLSRM